MRRLKLAHRSPLRDAKYRRLKRERDGVAVKVINSQLAITKRLLKSTPEAFFAPNKDELVALAAQLRLQRVVKEECGGGECVRFIPPGPRRARALGKGKLLRFLSRGKYVALYRGPNRVLREIFVIPADSVWFESD